LDGGQLAAEDTESDVEGRGIFEALNRDELKAGSPGGQERHIIIEFTGPG